MNDTATAIAELKTPITPVGALPGQSRGEVMNRAQICSVVIPTFGRPEKLRQTIEALDKQDCRDFEVIVVDDGSPQPITRESLPLSDRFHLRVLRQENSGPAAARNFGARQASGRILLFTDDDCRPSSAWVSTLSREVESHPTALVGSLTFSGLHGNKWSAASQLIIDLVYDHFNGDPDNAYFLASNNIACGKDLFLETGGFDTEFPRAGAEDRDFCDLWRMKKRPIRLRRESLVEHRHAQNFRTFLDLHYRYGCGAYLYQAKRKKRGSGTMSEDLGFHRTLIRTIPRRLQGLGFSTKASLVFALACWQAANAAGFFRTALSTRGTR